MTNSAEVHLKPSKVACSFFQQGIAINLSVNAILLGVTILAYGYSNSIPLVIESPSRFSVLIVPFLFGALVAAVFAFANYFSLPGYQKALPMAGMLLVGYTLSIFFETFGSISPPDLLDAYTKRLDRISILILLFSLLTMSCSTLKVVETRRVKPNRRDDSAESNPAYWLLKILVGDLPIVVSASVVIAMQHVCADCAHQNSTNVYFSILKSVTSNISRGPESLALLEIQRQLSVANFWIGVSLGVTGVQLVMQQISSLSLDLAFFLRKKFQ